MDATKKLPKSRIESVLSVSPFKVTEPQRVYHVLISDTCTSSATNSWIGGCYQIVMYYEKLKKEEEEHDEFLTGWMVESLAMVLMEYPLLAGRLQRKEERDNIDKTKKEILGIMSNDSGIRLYEALFPMALSEFLGLNKKEHFESELVFWNEIDEHSPEFFPLFNVQVTKFECGGYSIGISCSLLLADNLVIENFINKWAKIHNTMLPQNENIKKPLFYHPLLKKSEPPPVDLINHTPIKNATHTIALKFNVNTKDLNFNKDLWNKLTMLSIAEAEKKFDQKLRSDFYVFVKESSAAINVQVQSVSTLLELNQENQIIWENWNDFRMYDVAFHEGNKLVHVSRWIGSVANHGHVIIVPCYEENVSVVILVSLPFEKVL